MFDVLYKTAVARLHKLKQHTKALEIFVNNYYSLQIFLQSQWITNLIDTGVYFELQLLIKMGTTIRTRNHVLLTVSAQNKNFSH
jgi:hypothetical protein